LKVIEMVAAGLIGTAEAAERVGVTQRQIQRQAAAYRREGDVVLAHGLRGRRANNAIDEATRARAMEVVRTRYADHGPTLAAETLAEEEGIAVSRETMRRWMTQAGLWAGSRPRRKHRRRRPRRRCFGELVQIDTSDHDWLEGRGEQKLMLITMIDDATGYKLARLVRSDTTKSNLGVIAEWIERHGRPWAIYADRASHFKPPQVAGKRPPKTQIERALEELGIELIGANSPQAKGRVERSHGTDQDRLVKALRRAGAQTLSEADRYLTQTYLPAINAKFARPPADPIDAHRSTEGWDLEAVLCVHQTRRVNNDWTLSLDGALWQIEPAERTDGLRGQRVTVEQRLDGSLRLRHGDRYLKFHRCEPHEPPRTSQEAVDMPPRGQSSAAASRADLCPPGLNYPPARASPPLSAGNSHAHNHDDDEYLLFDREFEELNTPVRIINRGHIPKPEHPWR
jgi:transposase